MFGTIQPFFFGIVPIEKGQAIFTCHLGAASDNKV